MLFVFIFYRYQSIGGGCWVVPYLDWICFKPGEQSLQGDLVLIHFQLLFQSLELLITAVITPQAHQRALLLQRCKRLGVQSAGRQARKSDGCLTSFHRAIRLIAWVDLANGRTRRKSPGKNKELLVYILAVYATPTYCKFTEITQINAKMKTPNRKTKCEPSKHFPRRWIPL